MVGRGGTEKGGAATKGNVKRGDIYFVVGGEATGSEQGADRPAIVVSNNAGNKYSPVVELVYLTTGKKSKLPTHVFIGSAPRPSIALCEQIVTVCKSRLERRMGSATEEEMKNIDKALSKSLGIQRTGGAAMQLTMKSPFGEMNFDMPPEKVSDLMQRAIQYAAGQDAPAAAPVEKAPEGPKTTAQPKQTVSRVERMFGSDFRKAHTVQEAQETAIVGADGKLNIERTPEEYKGFLLIKCDKCGAVKGFCAKTPITASRCECGGRTELNDLKPLHLKCKCGSSFTYKTNITDEVFDYPCLKCGSPVDLELNKRRDTYVTIAG